ncbi:MAG: UDP-N-acetylglucosamine 2-epimerase (non-hydrolyzing) [Verrucomicrobia bacterium]|nr:UDP-N-acetylglucosamine 2-epimerase (non-hydrolyzing) [Verrucomicrobiota bacterium]
MKKIKIVSVVGARPNFMKIAPFAHAIAAHNERISGECRVAGEDNSQSSDPCHLPPATCHPTLDTRHSETLIEHFLVHTGQHYDKAMSHTFFESLNIPHPDVDLGIGSGSHAEQVGRTMIEFEKVLLAQKPDWVVVVGDVNATAACSITAKKCHVNVAHIEAGLRSYDQKMPEEINRMVTDSISDLLLTPDEFAAANLRREGHAEGQIKFVGNIMIDTLEANRSKAAGLDINQIIKDNLLDSGVGSRAVDLHENGFSVLTMHRPSNVDSREVLEPLVRLLTGEISAEFPLVWSLHPRTKKNLQQFGLWEEVVRSNNIILINPIGYHEMLKLNMTARVLLTDSGGLQEESCVLGTPCITMRETTERPVTLVEHGGVSELTGPDPDKILTAFRRFVSAQRSANGFSPRLPPLWDGHAAERMVAAICAFGG